MEGWTQDISNWDRYSDSEDIKSGIELSEITEIAKEIVDEIPKFFELMDYLSIPFGIQKVDRALILKSMKEYLDAQIAMLSTNDDIGKLEPQW